MRYRLLRKEIAGPTEWDIMEFFESEQQAHEEFNDTETSEGWEVTLVDLFEGIVLARKG